MSFVVPLIPGDGIGSEVFASVKKIFEASAVPLEWEELKIGQSALDAGQDLLPSAALAQIQKYGYALKGPLQTPVIKGVQDIKLSLCEKLHLFARIHSFHTIPGVPSRYSGVNMVLISDVLLEKENTSALERHERLLKLAFDYARRHQRKKITLVHHSATEEYSYSFLRAGLSISKEYPEILLQDMELEKVGMALVDRPERFDILVSSGHFSGILTHLGMALTGGIALTASSIVGKEITIFEAAHGAAKDITAMGIANPVAMIRAGLLLLEHLGLSAEALKIREALMKVLADSGSGTVDIGGSSDTEKFTLKIIAQIN